MTLNPSLLGDRRPRLRLGPWLKAAIAVWAVAFLIMAIRQCHPTHRVTTLGCYITAGNAWRNGAPIYTNGSGMGFVYSPLFAAYFAVYSFFPNWLGSFVWLLTNIGLLVGGAFAVLREDIFSITSDKARALTLILMLPLSLASLDVAQANSGLIGLLLIGLAAARRERWMLCAIVISVATYLKIYPLCLGLVLCVFEPRKVPWRLALALISFGLLSLVLQNPHYVLTQYHDWIATRMVDDRRLNSLTHAPLDLWFLLVRIGHLPISEHVYVALQLLSGASIAGFCLIARRQPRGFTLAGIFLLCSCWMILLGPATESYTYAILAPAVALGLVEAYCAGAPLAARCLASLSMALLLLAQFKNSFMSAWRSDTFNGLRPLGALLFLAYAIWWLCNPARWSALQREIIPQTD